MNQIFNLETAESLRSLRPFVSLSAVTGRLIMSIAAQKRTGIEDGSCFELIHIKTTGQLYIFKSESENAYKMKPTGKKGRSIAYTNKTLVRKLIDLYYPGQYQETIRFTVGNADEITIEERPEVEKLFPLIRMTKPVSKTT